MILEGMLVANGRAIVGRSIINKYHLKLSPIVMSQQCEGSSMVPCMRLKFLPTCNPILIRSAVVKSARRRKMSLRIRDYIDDICVEDNYVLE